MVCTRLSLRRIQILRREPELEMTHVSKSSRGMEAQIEGLEMVSAAKDADETDVGKDPDA